MRGRGAAEIDGAIDDYLDHLTSERGVARNTMEAYARDLAAFAGFLARRGEQLNLQAGFVTVVGKGGKERVVPLGRAARAALEAYLHAARGRQLHGRASPFVFVGHRGRALTRQAIWKIVRRRARAAGLGPRGFPPVTRPPLPA